MALPLLAIKPSAIAARVSSFGIPGDEASRQSQSGPRSIGANEDRRDLDIQIDQAYRQIFFHAFKVDRDAVLESQFRSGQITMRDFVRGLLLSRKFRDDFYRVNSNYRMVEQIVGRVLGRPVHGEAERIAYSILIAEQGLPALVDNLLDSTEYLDAFGYDTVPFQRSRVLPGQAVGTLPFNQQAPRYDGYWRDVAARRAPVPPFSGRWTGQRPAWLADAPAPWARRLWQNTVAAGGFALTGLVIWTAVAMLSTAR
jgi:phycobilisome rod-core linker protein